MPRAAALAVDAETVVRIVCDICQVTKEELFRSRRGVANRSRDQAIYILKNTYLKKTLTEIRSVFLIKIYFC
ncbi:MAG TPA: hypothetical protein EYP64_04750 [Desulfarculaceae bacterium]|nr:hypothetical protein [Desulfarculaceae bacterium]